MKLSVLLTFNAVVALAYGLSLLIAPATVLGMHGLSPGEEIDLVGRFFGVELLGIGLMCWLGRKTNDRAAQGAFIVALLISAAAGLLITLAGTLAGTLNAMGWLASLLYLALTLGYGYFAFTRRAGQ